jgi:peroxiredoxin
MLPQEREMVQRLADKPFTLLGINSDQSRSALKKIIDEQRITWPQVFDGGTRGPIAKQWNVKSWPTVYVIDQQGIIRFRNVRGEALEKAVNSLLGKGPRKADAATSKPAPGRGERPGSGE